MIRLRKNGQPIFFLMIFLTLFISVPFEPALAGLIETEAMISPYSAENTRALLKQLMARDDVRKELLAYGIDPMEADARIACLTDSEISLIANKIGNLPSGGDIGTAIAMVGIAAVLVFLLIFIILMATGVWAGLRIAEKQEADFKSTTVVTPPSVQQSAEVNPSEPWTGKWRVQGSIYASGLWILKQDGQMVVSTDASLYSIKGTVAENRLEGTYTKNPNYIFRIVISPDGQYFEGHATDKEGTRPIQGVRIK